MLVSETVLLLSGTLEVAEDALAAVSTAAASEPVAEELLSAVLDVYDAVLTVLSEPELSLSFPEPPQPTKKQNRTSISIAIDFS